jgi:hypothetical protein
MRRFLIAALLAFLPSTGFAQFGGMGGMGGGMGGMGGFGFEEWTVKLETVNDRTVSGTLTLMSIPVQFDLGIYYLKPEAIKVIRFTRPGEKPSDRKPPPHMFQSDPNRTFVRGYYGVSVTTKSEEIVGDLFVAEWSLKTELGSIMLDPSQLKSLTIVGRASQPSPPPTGSQ